MSNIIYPLGLIASQTISPYAPVIVDEFESGLTSTRRLWAANNFKRLIEVTHQNLTLQEYRFLRSFYTQCNAGQNSFWYRDNIGRTGNINCRFAQPERASGSPTLHRINAFAPVMNGMTWNATATLAEIAPIRALPEFDEVTAAAGAPPIFWFDANREFYLSHAGSLYTEPAAYDAYNQKYPAAWQQGYNLVLGNVAAQYQNYDCSNTAYARTPLITDVAAGTPGFTLFIWAKNPTASAKQILCSLGVSGAGAAMGLTLAADNHYEPWVGGTETWTTARFNNSPANTWRSFCINWSAGSGVATLSVNGNTIGADTVSRAYAQGAATLNGTPDTTLLRGASNLNHFLAFASASVSASGLHNLFAYQFS